jgi:hypothetical protein
MTLAGTRSRRVADAGPRAPSSRIRPAVAALATAPASNASIALHPIARPVARKSQNAADRSRIALQSQPGGAWPKRKAAANFQNRGALPVDARGAIVPAMSVVGPIVASSREPAKPRRVPKHIRHLVELMVRGREDDPDCAPLSFIEAARIAGVAPDVARRWTDRAEFRALLRSERASFRATLCASNEAHLARLRSSSPNQMVQLNAVRVLEQIETEEAEHRTGRGQQMQPGLVIVIERDSGMRTVDASPVTFDPPAVIEHGPADEPELEAEPRSPDPRLEPAVLRQPPRR